jgi:hypothetical protein
MATKPNALIPAGKSRVKSSYREGTQIHGKTGRVKLSDLLIRRGQSYGAWAKEWGVDTLSDTTVSLQCDDANIELNVVPMPEEIANWAPYLIAWYRADSVELSGSTVNKMYEKLGTGRDLGARTNYAGATRPRYTLSNPTYNGQPSVDFYDLHAQLTASMWNLGPQDGVGYTHFFVYTPFNWGDSGGQALFDFSITKTNVREHGTMYREGQLAISVHGQILYSWPGSIPMPDRSQWPAWNSAQYLTIADNTGSWRRSSVWVTGTLVQDDYPLISGSKPEWLILGSNADSSFFPGVHPIYPFSGSFAEVLIFSGTLPRRGIADIHSYIANRYAIG